MGKTLRTEMLYQNKEWLQDLYVKQKLSTVEIARIYREQENRWCDPNTISRWLKKHNIPIRSLAEAQQNRHADAVTAPVRKRSSR